MRIQLQEARSLATDAKAERVLVYFSKAGVKLRSVLEQVGVVTGSLVEQAVGAGADSISIVRVNPIETGYPEIYGWDGKCACELSADSRITLDGFIVASQDRQAVFDGDSSTPRWNGVI